MTRRAHSTPREVAAQVVGRVLDEGAWIGAALDAALAREGASWDARDRGFCTELTYGAVRWAVPLERSLLRGADKPGRGLDRRSRPHLLVAAYQLQHLEGRVPAHAAVNEAIGAIRKVRPGLAGFSNALLRKLGSAPHLQLRPGADVDELATAFGVPPVLAAATVEDLPQEEHAAALAALNERPSLGLRFLGPASEQAGFFEELQSSPSSVSSSARPHPFVPSAFLTDGAGSPQSLPGWDEGRVLVMDPGSQICALLVDPPPGALVLDLCAAPGGKSALLSRAVGKDGTVIAVEKDPRRAERIEQNARRLQIDVKLLVADATALPSDVPAEVDAVLLDAPCSGLGTVRRHPEIRLRRDESSIAENSALQRRLLDAAAARVRPLGTLVYSVCTPVRAEGGDVVRAFLDDNPAFRIDDPRATLPWLPDDAVTAEGFVRLHVHRHETDAFFAARLVRNGS